VFDRGVVTCFASFDDVEVREDPELFEIPAEAAMTINSTKHAPAIIGKFLRIARSISGVSLGIEGIRYHNALKSGMGIRGGGPEVTGRCLIFVLHMLGYSEL